MAGKFKYIKKMIVTITRGPRKGQKELRYFYKGGSRTPNERREFKYAYDKFYKRRIFEGFDKAAARANARMHGEAAVKKMRVR